MTGRKMIATTVLALAVVGSVVAADITGKWQAEFDSPVGVQKYVYEFKVEGEKLTGKASGEVNGKKRESEIKEGKVKGDDVTFVEILKIQDMDVRIEYKGKVSGDEIKFTRKVGDFGENQLVAKRAKDADTKAKKDKSP